MKTITRVEIISKQMIKPSSPTPHLKNYKLSFLDQLAPNSYVRMIMFYDVPNKNMFADSNQRSLSLMQALSKTLTLFYPLAGRIREGFTIECNDEGAEYIEAQVACKIEEMVELNDAKELNLLFPYDVHLDFRKEVVLAIQYNLFECGGFAVALSISHKVVDGHSANEFVNAWVNILRQSAATSTTTPDFNGAVYFPQRDISDFMPSTGGMPDNDVVMKRFVFKESSIEALRQVAGFRPTRVVAVSAFIWRRLIAIYGSKGKQVAALHSVNLRRRMVPPLADNLFGSNYRYSAVGPESPLTETEEKDIDRHGVLAKKLSDSIKEVDGEYVKKLQEGEWYMDWMKEIMNKYDEIISFTSWTRFPIYEFDFAWGKPRWATSLGRPVKNVITLTSAKNGDGFEVWVSLLKEDMGVFENDPELLSFV